MSMAYDANHFYALLDSEIEHRFPIALDKAIEKAEEAQARRLVITQKNRQFIIAQPSIIYFERILRITEINCTSEFYSTYESLDQLQKQLNPDLFIRCHQSYIVNLEKSAAFPKPPSSWKTADRFPSAVPTTNRCVKNS